MRSVLLLLVVIVGVAVVVWGVQRLRSGPPALSGRPAEPLEGQLTERAMLAHGPDRGPGLLQLTPSQIVFTADTGRVLAIERLDVTGVTDTKDLPDQTIARAVLAITTRSDVYYFAVQSPALWERHLH